MTTYAVNRKTKEHRISNHGESWAHPWQLLSADKDGWIEWYGGECPLPDDAPHEVKWRDESITADDSPETWDWNCGIETIIAYRPILDTNPEPPAWDGEGLPPVGAVVEMYDSGLVCEGDQEYTAEVVAHHNGVAVYYTDNGMYLDSGSYPVRPIRSEEDREVDAVWKDIESDVSAYNVDIDCSMAIRKTIDAMIKAGYRKQ